MNEYENKVEEYKEVAANRPMLEVFSPFDETARYWPVCFDFSKLPPIPKAQLNEVPKSKRIESISEYLAKHSIKGTMTAVALSKAQEDHPVSCFETAPEMPGPLDDGNMSVSTMYATTVNAHNKSGLSYDLLEKILSRQSREDEARRHNEEAIKKDEKKKLVEELTKIADQVVSFFTFTSNSCEPLKKVLEALEDSQRGSFQSKEFLRQQITLLTQIAPHVFKVISSLQGQMLKILNKRVQHLEIRERIAAHYTESI